MPPYPISIYEQNRIVLISNEFEYADFCRGYMLTQAAGGIVQHFPDRILMIYRLAHWDFPKGKVERGEQHVAAAIREVREETGIGDIRLIAPLPSTFHTYMLHGQPVLKETHWFAMSTTDTQLTPQTAEDITRAEWIPRNKVDNLLQTSYPSLMDLWKKIV